MKQPEVVVVGAGPCGSTIGNLLGVYGVRTVVVDRDEAVVPYPRAVGVDDESLRTFQSAGLGQTLHDDMIQNQQLRYFDSRGRSLADVAPVDSPFGWPRRNSFLQPLLDRGLRDGLGRHDTVELWTGVELTGLRQDPAGVTVTLTSPDSGESRQVEAAYLVGADGGRSTVRRLIGASLEGRTLGARWLVVDLRDATFHAPYAGNFISFRRPYVSIDLPYGHRRFEFRLRDDESDATALSPGFVEGLIRERFDWDGAVSIVERPRVYSHHSRVADVFGSGRAYLAGDAAHLQPPWFGQGMNSGIRDAANLSWKLAAVLRHGAPASVLDSYGQERRGHAIEMVQLATFLGRIYSPRSAAGETVRSVGFRVLRRFPGVRDYLTSMRFKPMPRYLTGVVHHPPGGRSVAVGRMFIQPEVQTTDGQRTKLDDVIGPRFGILGLNCDPTVSLDAGSLRFWEELGTTFIRVNRSRAGAHMHQVGGGVLLVDDLQGRLRDWQAVHRADVLFIRPDRYLAGAAVAADAEATSRALRALLS